MRAVLERPAVEIQEENIRLTFAIEKYIIIINYVVKRSDIDDL